MLSVTELGLDCRRAWLQKLSTWFEESGGQLV